MINDPNINELDIIDYETNLNLQNQESFQLNTMKSKNSLIQGIDYDNESVEKTEVSKEKYKTVEKEQRNCGKFYQKVKVFKKIKLKFLNTRKNQQKRNM